MAVKPVNLFRWASSGAGISEPLEGDKTTGFPPSPTPKVLVGELLNWFFNGAYQWFQYLDAVETFPHTWNKTQTFAPDGTTSAQAIQATGGGPNGNAIIAQGTGGGAAVNATGGTGSGGFFTGGLPNGTGIKGFGKGTAPGGDFLGGSAADGVKGVGGGAGNSGVYGLGGPTSGVGVWGAGVGTGAGVSGVGGATGVGGQFTGSRGVKGTGLVNEGVWAVGAPGAPGLLVEPGAAGLIAVNCAGSVNFLSAPSGGVGFDKQQGSSNLIRAWARCGYNGLSANPTVSVSFGVSGVFNISTNQFYVDLIWDMGPVAPIFSDFGPTGTMRARTVEISQSVVGGKTRITFQLIDTTTGGAPATFVGLGFNLIVTAN